MRFPFLICPCFSTCRSALPKGSSKRDIHESSLILQQRVREVYLEQEALDDRFRVIDCSAPDGSMLDPDSIFERIARQVDRMLPLPEGKR